MKHLGFIMFLIPATLAAQVRIRPDPMPERTDDWTLAAGRVTRKASGGPVAAQFDSLGLMPMGVVGDSVTVYLFGDGQNLSRVHHAAITSRRRFDPPVTWRAACDEVAHPGWLFDIRPVANAQFTVVVPGVLPKPVKQPPPPASRAGAEQFFRSFADTTWEHYRTVMNPVTEREIAYLWNDFYGNAKDAGWNRIKLYGLRGPNGHNYAVFSVWLHDDSRYGAPNTTATWVVNAWGWPVARTSGNVDIYGTVDADGDGIDEAVTSSGLIRWNDGAWRFPPVYDEEPCLAHQILPPPASRGTR